MTRRIDWTSLVLPSAGAVAQYLWLLSIPATRRYAEFIAIATLAVILGTVVWLSSRGGRLLFRSVICIAAGLLAATIALYAGEAFDRPSLFREVMANQTAWSAGLTALVAAGWVVGLFGVLSLVLRAKKRAP